MRRMSRCHADAGVLTLNDSVSPRLMLMAVAKPWMVESPTPDTCQSLAGSPGRLFSQATTLVTGTAHGSLAAADGVMANRAPAAMMAAIVAPVDIRGVMGLDTSASRL